MDIEIWMKNHLVSNSDCNVDLKCPIPFTRNDNVRFTFSVVATTWPTYN